MRNLKAGMALALAGSLCLSPLQLAAAGQNKGFLSGQATAEAKKPYPDYAVRARNVTTGAIEATASSGGWSRAARRNARPSRRG